MTTEVQHRSHRNLISRMRLRAATAALALAAVLVPGMIATPSAQAQTFTTRQSFDSTDGLGGDPILPRWATTFTVLHSFDGTDGYYPAAGLVQATDGNLYGTTEYGGANFSGNVFKITPSGTLTTLYSFCSLSGCADGEAPTAALVQATDGNFYGTTEYGGGANFSGTVFRITPSGTLTTLYSFCLQSGCPDGEYPTAALVQATDGNLYGTTAYGGANESCEFFGSAVGCGSVFKITPSGTLTTVYSFCSQNGCADGEVSGSALVQATDGNFYGTTVFGGANGNGTVFKITPSGTLTTLHSFCSQTNCGDGEYPTGALVQATDGNLYGTTYGGGANLHYGTVFKITPSGTLTTLYSFCSQTGCTDGANPYYAGLVQATNGDFYGAASSGGTGSSCYLGCGTIFEITARGTLRTLHSFNDTDGADVFAGLVQDTNGKFYGTTAGGGANSDGTVFSLSVGLGPFVETLPTSGKVGGAVEILGTHLTGAASVKFNGTTAAFKVVSGSLISATVPEGATTGKVEVTTPHGTLKSNLPFRVLP